MADFSFTIVIDEDNVEDTPVDIGDTGESTTEVEEVIIGNTNIKFIEKFMTTEKGIYQ